MELKQFQISREVAVFAANAQIEAPRPSEWWAVSAYQALSISTRLQVGRLQVLRRSIYNQVRLILNHEKPMISQASTALAAIVVAGVTMLGTPRAFAQTPPLPRETQSTFDTVEAPVLKVFSAEQDGHRFIAYLVKWKDFDVIVSDPLGGSNFQEGDKIRFLAQRVSLQNKSDDVAALNFVLLVGPTDEAGADDKRAGDSDPSAERQRQMKIINGDLGAARNQTERFYALNRAAKNALKAGKTEEAEKLANELLRMARTRRNDWNYGNAIQDANQVLGRIALSKGDVAEARKRLLASADSDGSPQMNSFGPNMQLAKELLAKGEKEVVIEYFDRCSAFWKMGAEQLAAWSESASKGEIPEFGANLNY